MRTVYCFATIAISPFIRIVWIPHWILFLKVNRPLEQCSYFMTFHFCFHFSMFMTNVSLYSGTWKCKWCVFCVDCGTVSPGHNCDWQNHYSQCGPCAAMTVCPLCKRQYREEDLIILCMLCDRWVHAGKTWAEIVFTVLVQWFLQPSATPFVK